MKFQSQSRITNQPRQQFFNDSFYHERIEQVSSNQKFNENTYISYEFVKKYFQATKINQLINKAVRTTLESPYLPENPYNMIGRLLLHECIYENIRAYFSMIPTFDSNVPNSNQPSSQRILADLKIGNNYYTIGWKLANYVRIDRISALWSLLFPSRSKRGGKSTISDISYGLGGSLILRMGSPYSAEESVTPIILFKIKSNQSKQQYQQFADYIIDDCIQICQSANNIFMKLYIYNHEKMSTEWSIDHLIHNRTKVGKQIYKSCISSMNQFKVEYFVKVPEELVKNIGTLYIRVNKIYVLFQEDEKNTNIVVHSIQPVTLLLNAIFSYESEHYQNIIQSFGTVEEVIHRMYNELHNGIIYTLEQQEPSWIGWCLFFINIYDIAEGRNKEKDLKLCINFLIDSPLCYIDELKHEIKVSKILCSKYKSISYQEQIIHILQKCEKKIKQAIKKQQHVYPQTIIFFRAIVKNLELILENQNNRYTKNIKIMLEKIQILIKYLLNSFYQICLVLKGFVLNQIVKIDNQFGKDGSGEVISTTVTYDIFLRKYKDLPERTLNIPQNIKKLKQTIYRPDEDIRQLILAKYVKNYGLYQKIYQFYWGIICGKKLSFPMGQFVTLLRNQAIRFQYQPVHQRKKKFQIEETKTDGIIVYKKAADRKGQQMFFALSQEVLEDENVINYRTIKEIFDQYFQNDPSSQKSSQNMGYIQKNSYIISICSNISRIKSQESDFNKCKIYVDYIYHIAINPNDIYRLIYNEMLQKLTMLTKNGFGVIGIYNGQKQFIDEDEVIPWTQHEQKFDINFLRYQVKKIFSMESLMKLVKNCKMQEAEILVRGIFWLNGLLKNCQISFNFRINKEWMVDLTSTYKTRVFTSFEDVSLWGDYYGLKSHIRSSRQLQSDPKLDRRESLKQKYLSNRIDLITFIAGDMQQPLDVKKLRSYSPFYSQLEQALSLVESLFYLLEYVKIDKENKFQVKDFKTTVEMLQYYLFVHVDLYRIVVYGWTDISIVKVYRYIHRYLDSHEDNNGEEKQLICLQKTTIKLMNCIRHGLVSCAFGVMEAMESQDVDGKNDQ